MECRKIRLTTVNQRYGIFTWIRRQDGSNYPRLDCFLLKYYTVQRWKKVCKESWWMLFFRNSTQSLQLSTRIAGKCHIFEQNNVASRDGEHHLACPCVVPRHFSPSPCYRYMVSLWSQVTSISKNRYEQTYRIFSLWSSHGKDVLVP